jgi:hypothetical protein
MISPLELIESNLRVSSAQVCFLADINESALGVEDPVRGAWMFRKKTGERVWVIALRGGNLYVSVIGCFGQKMDDQWMPQFGLLCKQRSDGEQDLLSRGGTAIVT